MKHISGATLIVVVLLMVLASSATASDPLVVLSAHEFHFGTQAQGTSSSPQVLSVANSGQALIETCKIADAHSSPFSNAGF